MRWTAIAPGVVVLFTVASMPGASATNLNFTIDAVPGLLPPGGAPGVFLATFTADCQGALKQDPTSGDVGFGVTFDAGSQTKNIQVNGPSHLVIDGAPCLMGANYISKHASWNISATRDAPGLRLIQVTMNATLDRTSLPSILAAPSNPAPQGFDVEADYLPLLQANVAQTVLTDGPQRALSFTIKVENLGNANTTVRFALADPPADSQWLAVLPDPVVLDSPASGAGPTSLVLTFQVTTPHQDGWNNREQSFRLILTPTATVDPAKTGEPISVAMLARVQGFHWGAGLTATALGLLAILVAVALFAARRRKK
jgi:hypothetical protein